MGVREFTEKAIEMFENTSDWVAEKLAEPVKNLKIKVASKKVPWIQTAKSHYGIKEIPGSRSNQTILNWAKQLTGWPRNYYKNDDIPWCGLFVAHCLLDNDIPVTIENPLSAKAWNEYGVKIKPCFGAIMVFSRNGGGHVGFYMSEDNSYYHILGGNQSNSVNVTKVAKSRFLGARWPKGYDTLYQQNKEIVIHKSFDGEISTNEE